MIAVRLTLDASGCLRSVTADGHASDGTGLYGRNVVCAAASSLLRSFAAGVAANHAIRAEGRAPGAGVFGMRMVYLPTDESEWMRGATGVLVEGLRRLADEEPSEIRVDISQE